LGIDIKASAKVIAAKILQTEPTVFLRTLDGIHIATALELGSGPQGKSEKSLLQLEDSVASEKPRC